MATKSFIKRILSLGRVEDGMQTDGTGSTDVADVAGVTGEGALEAAHTEDATQKPSITEILFRRRSLPSEGAESETPETGETAAEVETPVTPVVSRIQEKALVPEKTVERKLGRREETAQKISEGFDNLSGLLKTIGEKMETGNERGLLLSESIEGLPEVLKSIPRTNEIQIEFLGTISKQLDLQAFCSGELVEHLKSLPEILRLFPEGQDRLAEQLTMLGSKFEEDSATQVAFMKSTKKAQQETLNAFQSNQNNSLKVFHKSHQDSLAAFQNAQAAHSEQLQDLVERTQQSMNRVLIACVSILGAAVIGGAALYIFG